MATVWGGVGRGDAAMDAGTHKMREGAETSVRRQCNTNVHSHRPVKRAKE